jgi:hypothetical protein
MRYVILRDDDTNALMPIACLERLYRPFLDRNLPVNLAVIPNASSQASYGPGQLEKFLMGENVAAEKHLPIGSNRKLVRYLLENPQFHIVQHGCRHDSVHERYEFDHDDRREVSNRLDEGILLLTEAGFRRPSTFVAPYDRLSRVSLQEVAKRFRVLSTGWYEWQRLPVGWWPQYLFKKMTRSPHWRVGRTTLLTHPGCHLSYHRSYSLMLAEIEKSIESRQVTVLVTHWWEYFRDGKPDQVFIDVLHETAAYLAARRDIRVISFDDIARERVSLN